MKLTHLPSRIRQGAPVSVPDAALNPSQVPSITTIFAPVSTGGVVTWLPFIYTQTFPAVPDQWPSPGAGSIGLGSHHKRDPVPVEARETGIAGRVRL